VTAISSSICSAIGQRSGKHVGKFIDRAVGRVRASRSALLALALWPMVLLGSGAARAHGTDIHCDNCKEWNAPQAPFNIYGNTYYVGPHGLASLLITGPNGHILLDGALPQSAPQIIQSIKTLGFRIEDVKLILNSHPYWDHSGGIAALQRASGAVVAASAPSAEVLERGTIGEDDPQFEAGAVRPWPKIDKLRIVHDGELLTVGPLSITAHMTPGHTPGGTSWTWRSCEGDSCQNIVYADSLNPVSARDFRYSGGAGQPDISASFKASIARLAALPCDIVVSVHPGFTNTFEKLAAREAGGKGFAGSGGCSAYAAEAGELLRKRLAREGVRARLQGGISNWR
jgi:metallo-beta-lactamase class B